MLRAPDKAESCADPEEWIGVARRSTVNQTIVVTQHRNRVGQMDSLQKLWTAGLGARLRGPVANVQIRTRFQCYVVPARIYVMFMRRRSSLTIARCTCKETQFVGRRETLEKGIAWFSDHFHGFMGCKVTSGQYLQHRRTLGLDLVICSLGWTNSPLIMEGNIASFVFLPRSYVYLPSCRRTRNAHARPSPQPDCLARQPRRVARDQNVAFRQLVCHQAPLSR